MWCSSLSLITRVVSVLNKEGMVVVVGGWAIVVACNRKRLLALLRKR